MQPGKSRKVLVEGAIDGMLHAGKLSCYWMQMWLRYVNYIQDFISNSLIYPETILKHLNKMLIESMEALASSFKGSFNSRHVTRKQTLWSSQTDPPMVQTYNCFKVL